MVVSILGRLAVGYAGNERAAIELVARALPSNFDFLSRQVVQLQGAPVPLTIAGSIVTIWASMGVFGAVTAAVDHAWSTDTPRTDFMHQLTAFLMMLAAAVVFALGLVMMGAAQVADTGWFHGVQTWVPGLGSLTSLVAQYSLTPVVILMMGLIYRYAPNTRVRFRDVWFGAILAGVLWRLALAAFSWYLRNVSGFTVHGSVGAVVAFLVWVYLSAFILLYGVEVTACFARARHDLGTPKVSSNKVV
jgi:membrane protein